MVPKLTIKMPQTNAHNIRIAERRSAVLNAAGEVFLTRGYEQATTSEIARLARTSKRTLYELFGSKQEILIALICETSARMVAPLALQQPETREDFFEVLEAFGKQFLGELLHPHRIAMYRLAISEAPRMPTVAQTLHDNGSRPVTEAFSRLFHRGAASGYISQNDIAVFSRVFFNTLIGNMQISLLLGTEPQPTPEVINERARFAVTILKKLTMTPGRS